MSSPSSSPTAPLLDLRDVSKRYESAESAAAVSVLTGISLAVARGGAGQAGDATGRCGEAALRGIGLEVGATGGRDRRHRRRAAQHEVEVAVEEPAHGRGVAGLEDGREVVQQEHQPRPVGVGRARRHHHPARHCQRAQPRHLPLVYGRDRPADGAAAAAAVRRHRGAPYKQGRCLI